jgi:carbon starvation protein
MNSLPFIIGALCVLVIAYRYYSAFLAAKVAVLDDRNVTPARSKADGQNYVATGKWVLFGHHFAAIAGAGPLIGPVLAAQFGFLPGFLWILIGVVLAGAVQDFMILFASTRHGAKSLADIAHSEIGAVAGVVAAIAVFVVVIIALAGLGFAVVNALKESSWGVFTIGATIPIAFFMGFHMRVLRPGKIAEATVIGVVALIAAVVAGRAISASGIAHYFVLSKNQITLAMAAYGFFASVLPVWLLLVPRDYLSTYMKLGTIGLLVAGIVIVHPTIQAPMFSRFTEGGGPIIPGKVFPFVFVTIACGAISGFHALVGSGTTPKMVSEESHIRAIGYGAMLMEGLVGLTCLIAACCLQPGDYFAINVPPAKYATLNMQTTDLPALQAGVGENVTGRTGGAVSLALGISHIFAKLPGMSGLMGYWYHFAIMFEALFILTTIDAGTRVARFLLQESMGRYVPKLGEHTWLPGNLIASLLVVALWSYFILTGTISTIWPMFGVANQLLAGIALCVSTTMIIRMGRARYFWVTAVPMCFVMVTTLAAGWDSIFDNYLPLARTTNPVLGYVDTYLTAGIMACVIVIFANAAMVWWRALSGRLIFPTVQPSH